MLQGNTILRFSYAGNWELVKSTVGKKFRRGHVCLHSQAGNNVPITDSTTANGYLLVWHIYQF